MMQRNRTAAAATHARISAAGGAVVLPVTTPYDWQVFGEHCSAAARHRGPVRVRIGSVRCEARLAAIDPGRRCSQCTCQLIGVAFRMMWRDLCLACTRRCVGGDILDPIPSGL